MIPIDEYLMGSRPVSHMRRLPAEIWKFECPVPRIGNVGEDPTHVLWIGIVASVR